MNNDIKNSKYEGFDGVYAFKNANNILGFVRFNENYQVEYISVYPIIRHQGIAIKLLQLAKHKKKNELILQDPINYIGLEILISLNQWK